ncbi:MAG: triose-phosphate isomerase [Syntrophales bacterium]|nr:triose-phosphate isomerase [Syntrophales bacterium]
MREQLFAANWKMHKTLSEAVAFCDYLKAKMASDPNKKEVVIAPPFTALSAVAQILRGTTIRLAAQNVHDQPEGPYTGEIAAPMLAEIGCTYVIVGHSERRIHFNEMDDFIERKLKAVMKSGMRPILCIGELLTERERGATFSVVESQLSATLKNIHPSDLENIVIAYEPVWAIGTGKTATPDQIEEMHSFIRSLLGGRFGPKALENIRIIYGGSVTPDNIKGIMTSRDVDGVLVGSASLQPDTFLKIINWEL